MAIPGLMEKSERLGGLFSGLEEMGGRGLVNFHYMDVIWNEERRDERSNIYIHCNTFIELFYDHISNKSSNLK